VVSHHGQEGFDVGEDDLRAAQPLAHLTGCQSGLHGFFLLDQVAPHAAEERLAAFVVEIGAEAWTEGVVDNQEVQVDAVVGVIGQFQVEEFIGRVFPVPGCDLDLVAVLFGFQFDLGQFIGVLPGARVDVEIGQHLDGDERTV